MARRVHGHAPDAMMVCFGGSSAQSLDLSKVHAIESPTTKAIVRGLRKEYSCGAHPPIGEHQDIWTQETFAIILLNDFRNSHLREGMGMQLGFASAILPDLAFEEVMRFAAEVGYECVEVMCWPPSRAERRYAGVTHIDITQNVEQVVDSVRAVVMETGVQISALGYYPNCLSTDEAEARRCVEHLMKLIEVAPRFGVSNVNTFIGRNPVKSVDENWPQLLETWKPIVMLAEKMEVRIGIENCPMLFTRDEWPGGKNLATSPAIWRRLFADLASEFIGLNYDPSHMVWQQMDYIRPLIDFTPKLFHLHAKDVRLDRQRLDEVGILAHPLEYHTPKLPGLGEVDWGRFFSVLADVGYRGAVCVEVEDRAYEGSLESRKQSLRQSYRYLRNFV